MVFLAPTITACALKSAIFAANLYENLGYAVIPDGTEDRHDIIQAVTFQNAKFPVGPGEAALEIDRVGRLDGRVRGELYGGGSPAT